ncbi:MAG: ABC-type transport auxiliary lipoprotein family protein [Desulfosalsimonadaceae bacterium]
MAQKRATGLVYACIAAALLLSAGCGLRKNSPPPTVHYHLDYPPPAAAFAPPLPIVLRVDSFQPTYLYSRQGIVYRDSSSSTSRYIYHKWIAPPDRMVPQLLARDLRRAGIARAVFLNGGERATHRLVGNIEAFYESDREKQWTAVAAIAVTLIDLEKKGTAEQICFQKNYKSRQPCPEKTPAAYVRAAGKAMSKISNRLATDIYKTLTPQKAKSASSGR